MTSGIEQHSSLQPSPALERERILVVEDAPDFQQIIRAALGRHYLVAVASSIAEARSELEGGEPYDLLVLDVNLPDGESFGFCGEVRGSERTRKLPVIFLTGRGDLEDKLKAFSLGGDDYIVKPFEVLELRARVEARLARVRARAEEKAAASATTETEQEVIMRGAIRFELATSRAYLIESGKKTELGLTPIEFKILYHLVRNESEVVSREQLLSTIWGQGVHVFERATDKHVSSLRQKLGSYATHIETVPGVGYRFALAAPPLKR